MGGFFSRYEGEQSPDAVRVDLILQKFIPNQLMLQISVLFLFFSRRYKIWLFWLETKGLIFAETVEYDTKKFYKFFRLSRKGLLQLKACMKDDERIAVSKRSAQSHRVVYRPYHEFPEVQLVYERSTIALVFFNQSY